MDAQLGGVQTMTKMVTTAMVQSRFDIHTSRYVLWTSSRACRVVSVAGAMAATVTVTVTVGKGKLAKYRCMMAPERQQSMQHRVGQSSGSKLANT